MSEVYQHKEHELRSAIDNINCISYIFEDYVKETNYFIDRLLEDTKEINTLRNENKRLHSIIKEVREYTSKTQMPEGYKKMILEILDKE